MSDVDPHARGGATIGVLNTLESWESFIVLNLRLWCDGADGQAQVWAQYRATLPIGEAKAQCATFETLVRTITSMAQRPLVRHDVACACVGADEGIFLHLIRTASDGHLNDAALIATLLAGPAQAGQVGACARRMHSKDTPPYAREYSNVVHLH